MSFRFLYSGKRAWLVIVGLLFLSAIPAHGEQKVPIQFTDYHGYSGAVKYVGQVAGAYPEITELLEIGKSEEGRPILVLVISNMKNGTTLDAHVPLRHVRKEGVKNVAPQKTYLGKPGHWIGGAIHGNEHTGTEVCLYIIDKLVSGYGSDDGITGLVDRAVFYICPAMNPDGQANTVEKGVSQRSNSMKIDNDGDGKINEDGPDDLNGDGHITQFRYPDEKGRYVIDDEDPRLMVRIRRDEETDKQRYSVVTEDRDNDGDGKRGEDTDSGIDLNRNYPEGWFKKDGMAGGSGSYPTSAPETQAVVEFFTHHRNILMAQFYHTSGGFTFRPMGTASHKSLNPRDVAVFDLIMGKKYLEIIGEEIPEAWQKPETISAFKEKLKETSKNEYAKMRGYELPRGWRVSYNESGDKRYSYGMATDWAYKQYGIYSITTELWNQAKDIEELPRFEGKDAGVYRQRALLKYQDEKYGGKLFVPWEKYDHPELGEGEIGGWIPKYRGNAFPGDPLINVCEKHWQFERFRAGLLPEIAITEARAKVLYTTDRARDAKAVHQGDHVKIQRGDSTGKYRVVEVSARIENKGKLATQIDKGEQLSWLREDVVWVLGDRDKVTFLQGTPMQKLGVLDGVMEVPGFKGRSGGPPPETSGRRFSRRRATPEVFRKLRPRRKEPQGDGKKSGSSREVKWLLAVEGDPPLKIVVSSQKGGTKVENLTIE